MIKIYLSKTKLKLINLDSRLGDSRSAPCFDSNSFGTRLNECRFLGSAPGTSSGSDLPKTPIKMRSYCFTVVDISVITVVVLFVNMASSYTRKRIRKEINHFLKRMKGKFFYGCYFSR